LVSVDWTTQTPRNASGKCRSAGPPPTNSHALLTAPGTAACIFRSLFITAFQQCIKPIAQRSGTAAPKTERTKPSKTVLGMLNGEDKTWEAPAINGEADAVSTSRLRRSMPELSRIIFSSSAVSLAAALEAWLKLHPPKKRISFFSWLQILFPDHVSRCLAGGSRQTLSYIALEQSKTKEAEEAVCRVTQRKYQQNASWTG
jgi:hypothetical protein